MTDDLIEKSFKLLPFLLLINPDVQKIISAVAIDILEEIKKPKKLFDIFKQVIPIKQKPQVELAKPKKLELEKPKLKLEKPKALTLNKADKPKLDPAMKKIDLSNEIGKKKLSAAQV